MSERLQGTTARMRASMIKRYGDELGNNSHKKPHKHCKDHTLYRQHCRSHPVQQRVNGQDEGQDISRSTGHVREWNLRKFCTRVAKGSSH